MVTNNPPKVKMQQYEREAQVLDLISANPTITPTRVAEILEIEQVHATMIFKRLRDRKKIRRVPAKHHIVKKKT